jgi:uncharacterized membrane protein YobD (UPF0266 family)
VAANKLRILQDNIVPSHKVHDTLLSCFSADPTPSTLSLILSHVYTYFLSIVSYITSKIALKNEGYYYINVTCDFSGISGRIRVPLNIQQPTPSKPYPVHHSL